MVHPNVIGRCDFILLNSLELLERKREHIDRRMQMKWHHKIPNCKARGLLVTGLLVTEVGTWSEGESASSTTECFQLLFYRVRSFSPQHTHQDERLFYLLREGHAHAAFTLQTETLLPLTALLKYSKSIVVPARSPICCFSVTLLPFIMTSNFITINSIRHIVHDQHTPRQPHHIGI